MIFIFNSEIFDICSSSDLFSLTNFLKTSEKYIFDKSSGQRLLETKFLDFIFNSFKSFSSIPFLFIIDDNTL